MLTVKLVNGDELKGTVNDGTEIECDDAGPPDDRDDPPRRWGRHRERRRQLGTWLHDLRVRVR